MISASIQPIFDSWRDTARKMLIRNIAPDAIIWTDTTETAALLPELFETTVASPIENGLLPRVPPVFLASARSASLFRDPARWSLLYRLLWRLTHGEPNLLKITIDDDVDRPAEDGKAGPPRYS